MVALVRAPGGAVVAPLRANIFFQRIFAWTDPQRVFITDIVGSTQQIPYLGEIMVKTQATAGITLRLGIPRKKKVLEDPLLKRY